MVPGCESRRYVAMVDQLFVKGRLWSWRWRSLRRHLVGCERCRGHYDKVALLWQAMGPQATPPQVMASLADDLVRGLEPATSRSSRAWAWLAVGTAAVAALVLVARAGDWSGRPRGDVDGSFVARGDPPPSRLRGVRAFCLGGSGEGTVVRAAVAGVRPGAPVPELRCRLDDSLQLAYTLGAGDADFLLVVGRDEAGRLHWYAPATRGEAAPALRPGVVDEPLPASVRLSVNHKPGRVTIEAFFSSHPFSVEEVARAVESGQTDKLANVADRQQLTLTLQQ